MKKEISQTGKWALLLTSCLTIMVGTVIAPALPEIAAHLNFARHPGWLITLPSLGVVLFAPFAGRLIDAKGNYLVMCWGLIPYGVLGVPGMFLSNPYILVADRLLLGAATAALAASGTGLIAEYFEGEARMKMIAWQGMAIELGGVVFLSLGGFLGGIHWKLPFLIYLVALVCLVMVLLGIPKPSVFGNGSSVLEEKSGEEKTSGKIWGIVAFSVLAMILFFVAFVGLPQYLHQKFGFSSEQTGYFMAFISLVAVGSASIMPTMNKLLGPGLVLICGFLALAFGHFLFFWGDDLLALILAALSMGLGFGFTVPLLNLLTIDNSSPLNRGRNLGYYSMGIFGGQFLSSFLGLLSSDTHVLFLAAAVLGLCTALCQFYFMKR